MHVLWKFGRKPCDGPDCFRCTLKARRPPQFWRYTGMLHRMTRHVDQFIAPSRFTARMHAERGFQRDFVRLPNFIDACDEDWKNPAPRPWPNPYFFFAGRLELVKGPQTLIDAWQRAPGVDLLIAGTGSEESALRRRAAGNPRIRLLGPLGQRELGAYYHHALACIVPSVTYETFGLTSIEAFARKTPVIARNLGALPEVVEESGGGFVYDTEDQLLEAVRNIAGCSGLRDDLGSRGYEGFRKFWTRQAHLKLYFDLLGTIAERRSGAAVPVADRTSDNALTEILHT
jgi:glycosyltransferase involved in cell wall biosynthesis